MFLVCLLLFFVVVFCCCFFFFFFHSNWSFQAAWCVCMRAGVGVCVCVCVCVCGCDRELNCCLNEVSYSRRLTWYHIILTLCRPGLAIPRTSDCEKRSRQYHFDDVGMSRPVSNLWPSVPRSRYYQSTGPYSGLRVRTQSVILSSVVHMSCRMTKPSKWPGYMKYRYYILTDKRNATDFLCQWF